MPAKKTSKRGSTKTKSRAQKPTSAGKTTKRLPVQDRPAHKAFGYAGRVEPMVAALKELGGSATKSELFEALFDGDDGQFATERRIPATLRQNVGARELIANVGGVYSLVKRSRKVAAKSSARKSKRAARSK